MSWKIYAPLLYYLQVTKQVTKVIYSSVFGMIVITKETIKMCVNHKTWMDGE